MGLQYIARCGKCRSVTAMARADTPIEQAEYAGDVKKWTKRGDVVTLEPRIAGVSLPDLCTCVKVKARAPEQAALGSVKTA